MDKIECSFKARLWMWQGKGAWHFVALPKKAAEKIKFFNPLAKGFMPIACIATIGKTSWKTSVFPDSKRGTYLLAVKAEVRKSEKIDSGDTVAVTVSVKCGL